MVFENRTMFSIMKAQNIIVNQQDTGDQKRYMYEKSRVFPYHILRESSCLFWGSSFEILGGKFWARTAKIDPLRMPNV